ncbi:MAG: putative Response regulator/sensory box histidine kinase [Acidimicrobiales bacterium]|nr:putative Response regulator/sensory box histidine kinase [Acidimicrobiales bacterium]
MFSNDESRDVGASGLFERGAPGVSEERLRALVDLTKSYPFLVSLSEDGSADLEWISESFRSEFGYSVEELRALGGAMTIVHPDDLPRVAAIIEAMLAGEHPSGELRAVAKNGRTRWVRFHYAAENGPHPPGRVRLFGIAQDVTEEMAAREASEANAARFRAFFDRSPIGQLILSPDGILLGANPAFYELTGYGGDDLVGKSPSLIVHPRVLDRSEHRFRQMLDAAADRSDRESTWRSKDGRTIEVALTVVPERDPDGRVRQFVIAVQDVTERKRAEAERQALLDRLVAAHAEERVRLARELHDGLGQVLTSASLYASSIAEQAPPELARSLAGLQVQLTEALAATRTLAWRLRPVEVDELGLAGAVATLAEKTRQRHGLLVDVHISGLEGRLPPPTEAAIYRVVQEAVANSVRHADPQVISIVITRRGPVVVTVVEDDGAGFVLDAVVQRPDMSGMGILGMRERAPLVGGRLDIESRPGNGTTVRLEVPAEGEAGT